jgi:AcrR family transcriptional regulator
LSTREKILDAAIDLISKKGFDAVSIREIAAAVSIREGAIYNHFKSKDQILDTIIDFFIHELTHSVPIDNTDDLLDQLGPKKFVELRTKMSLPSINNPRMIKIWRIISIELYHNKKIKKIFEYVMFELPIESWERTFSTMIQKKIIKKYDPKLLAREFYSFAIFQYFFEFFIIYDENYSSFSKKSLMEWNDHVKFFMESITE